MIFVDTGPFLARYCAGDQFHKKALRQWQKLEEQKEVLYTSNFVLDETFTLLARRAGYGFACKRARVIYDSRLLRILRPDQADEIQGLILFSKYSDQAVSFTDCVSMALMHRKGIQRCFTFDTHFRLAGFSVFS